MADFIKALDLNEQFYNEIVAPLLNTHFPNLEYSAGLIGWGSEILGFDDVQSTDHNWGLRFHIFLLKEDFEKYFYQINQILDDDLPVEFRGFPTAFEVVSDDALRGRDKNFRHQISIETIDDYFLRYLGCDLSEELKPSAWLSFSEHKLLGVTSGKVFFDATGKLEEARQKLAYFPRDVWLYMLAAQWLKIFEEQAFVGRSAQVGDELGSTLIAARQVTKLMRLAFMIERKYAPYSKWFGTAFSRLDCADELKPIFEKVLRAADFQERQHFLSLAYQAIIQLFNDLKITEPMSDEITDYFSRPFLVIKDEKVVRNLLVLINNEEIKNIKHNLGSVNQFIDTSDQISDPVLTERLKILYQ